ncbi:hypothetical protein UCDDA912_g06062 [Diaporthe ampelina]|uniref:Uncharacterized protein n=1 Tax=Diaporthe ampelina TaxID=1214573 RepID=A0A0G2HFS9_9PEZI|nr:hypothetical protein UCDDA912_g06062 [Diaporthe ampelina]
MDFTYGNGRPSGRRYRWCLPCGILCGIMAFLTILIVGLVSYIDHGGKFARWTEGDAEVTREVPGPGYPGAPEPDEQLAMAGDNAPKELVVQAGQLHARSADDARRYAGQEKVAERDADVDGLPLPPFGSGHWKLPKLPIPTDVLDLPIKIPKHISDILGDLPAVPTIPTDPGDIADNLPTDPGELISDLPIPTLPTIPAIPTLPVPVPIPTEVPALPIPTVFPPDLPVGPADELKLPDLTQIPHTVLNLLHHAVSSLSVNDNTPKYLRDILRLILRVLNRVAGGDPVPKPPPAPTKTKLPLPPPPPLPTLPIPTRTRPVLPPLPTLPRPTLTLPHRPKPPGKDGDGEPARAAKKVRAGSGGDDREPLSDESLRQLRSAVADEVWAAADWSNPLVASFTAGMAMVTFDAVYRVAEALKATDDEAEKERLLGLFVVVDDDEEVVD